ncbi:MAG: hypothetical protein M3063_06530 [Actinomycetota bacterium]|nr:hypothetical protein [Actinomycetota bacterium]
MLFAALTVLGLVGVQGATRASAATGDITTVAGNVNNTAASGDGGPANSAGLAAPAAVAFDQAGNLYIADSVSSTVRKVTAATGIITTVAGTTGTAGFSGDGGAATSAQLTSPQGLAFDQAGNLYIADSGNSTVRKVTAASGTITTVAGNGNFGYSGDGGAATAATLEAPYGVAVDQAGNVYIADQFANVIRKVTSATGIITTVVGDPGGASGFGGDGGSAASALLASPQDVVVDGAGNLYIDDSGNQRVRKVTAATGNISTVAGNGTTGFSGDGGPAVSAALNNPGGLVLDGAGDIFISDTGNQRIRKVTASTGIINTVAGNGSAGFSGDGGPATVAQLNNPEGVTLDSSGNLYLADTFNHVIREVQGAAAPPTPSAGAYHPLTPTRVTDTRRGSGYPNSGSPVGPAGSVTVTMPAAVPTTATSVSLSVTAVDGTTNSFLTVYPTGQPPLTPTSVLNYVAGPPDCGTLDCVVPNLVISKVHGGQVTVVNGSPTGSVDVVVDLEGYFDPTAATTTGVGHYTPLAAYRVADTRCVTAQKPGFCASENLPPSNTTPTLGSGQSFNVPATGASGPNQGISAATVQLTVTNTTGRGISEGGLGGDYLTAYPTGATRPTASNVNWVAGQTTSTRAIVPVDANGNFTIYNFNGKADVVVDVVGLFSDATGLPTSGSLYTPVVPARLTDTRTGAGPLGPGTSTTFPVTGQAGIPAEANGNPSAATLNVTEASATALGFLTVTPQPLTPPATTSDVNFTAGEIRANADLAQLNNATGTVSIYNYAGTTQVAVDAFGYFSTIGNPGFLRLTSPAAKSGALSARR